MPWSPHLLLSFHQGQTQAQSWSEVPCAHTLGDAPSLAPLPYPEPLETALTLTLLPGGGRLVCDLTKEEENTEAVRADQLGHNDQAGASQTLWSSVQEPGPFLPQMSMLRSQGPEHVAEASHAPSHPLDHPAGFRSSIFVSPFSMDLPKSR